MERPDSVVPAETSSPLSTVPPTSDGIVPAAHPQAVKAAGAPRAGRRRWWVWIAAAALIVLALIEGVPWLVTAWTTVSTDDAYVNGHVTFVAARVPGQVTR